MPETPLRLRAASSSFALPRIACGLLLFSALELFDSGFFALGAGAAESTALFAYKVQLKRSSLVSMRKLDALSTLDRDSHSPKWLASMAAVDADIAHVVAALAAAYPRVKVSSVVGRNDPSFVMRCSAEEADRMARDPRVGGVENLGPADQVIENATMNPWQ